MEDNKGNGIVELAPGVYWVGTLEGRRGLDCNPYLIIEGDTGVLLDPGSVLDFEIVKSHVESLIPLRQVKYIILHHQDPDLASSTPLFEEAGFSGSVVTHWRTSLFLQYYRIRSPFYLVNENNYMLKLSETRTLLFIPASFMHFPGAVMTHDPEARILFSGDVFGAFSFKRQLWAGDDYMEAMKTFHENYIPSNQVIRPVMEKLRTIPLDFIASQHGSIIKGRENILRHISVLEELECGICLNSPKVDISHEENYTNLCNMVLKRYYSIFPKEDVALVFKDTEIELDLESGLIRDFQSTGKELWNNFFRIIYLKQSIKWLTAIESLIQKLVVEYNVEFPEVFQSVIFTSQKQLEQLDEVNRNLRVEAETMRSKLQEISGQLMTCSVTGLYNERFLIQFLMDKQKENVTDFSMLFIEIDNIMSLGYAEYDRNFEDELLNGLAYLLLNYIKEDASRVNYLLVKLNTPVFGLYVPLPDRKIVQGIAEELRNRIRVADIFKKKLTVSQGIVYADEYREIVEPGRLSALVVVRNGRARLMEAKKGGGDSICDFIPDQAQPRGRGKVLVVEPDEFILELFQDALAEHKIEVLVAADGETAMEIIEKETPAVIVCELNTPQVDGLTLKRTLNSSYRYRIMPFILLCEEKTEVVIQQALELDVRYFYSKPLIMLEVVGLIDNLIRAIN